MTNMVEEVGLSLAQSAAAAVDVAVAVVRKHRAVGSLAEAEADAAKVSARITHQRAQIDHEYTVLKGLESLQRFLSERLSGAQLELAKATKLEQTRRDQQEIAARL